MKFEISWLYDCFTRVWNSTRFSKISKNHENGEICSIFKSRKNSFCKGWDQTAWWGVSSRLVFHGNIFWNWISQFFEIFFGVSVQNLKKPMKNHGFLVHINFFRENYVINKISMEPERVQTIPDNLE